MLGAMPHVRHQHEWVCVLVEHTLYRSSVPYEI